jgi:hypothetical protein
MNGVSIRSWNTIILVIFGFVMPVSAGYYAKAVAGMESIKSTIEFPQDTKEENKPIIIDVAKFGGLKKIFQPRKIRIYASVKNNSQKPQRVGLALEDCPLPLNWHITDYTWDENARVIREPLPTGKRFGAYFFATIPEEQFRQPLICKGRIKVINPETGVMLASLTVTIVNSAIGPVTEFYKDGAQNIPIHDGAMHNNL